jgi:uncharacterized protein
MRRALVVSLHDVSPQTWEPCRRILASLDLPVSLLVIPDHHERGHFSKDSAFCSWLRERVAGGDEVVIHGYTHRRPQRRAESIFERLVTRGYTAGEGEFFEVSYDTARELVGRAREEFRAVGLTPCGFIAPAWLLSESGERAIRELGLRYTTRLRTISDFTVNREWNAQSFCWSVRAGWRRALSVVWNAFLFHRLENAPLLRIAIHPVDFAHPTVWRQVMRLVSSASAARAATTYERWLGSEAVECEKHFPLTAFGIR